MIILRRKLEVMSPFGTGNAGFPLSASDGERAGVKCRKSVGFNGPIMVEGVKAGATAQETTANARANREFLEKALGSI